MSSFSDLINIEQNTKNIDSNSSSLSTEQVQNNQIEQQLETTSDNLFGNNKDDFMSLISSTPDVFNSENSQQTNEATQQVVEQQVTQQQVIQKPLEKQSFNDSPLGFGVNIETRPPISFGILNEEQHSNIPMKKPFVPSKPQTLGDELPSQQEKPQMNAPIVHKSPFSSKQQNQKPPLMMPQQETPFIYSTDKPSMFIPKEQPIMKTSSPSLNDSMNPPPQNGFFKPFVPKKPEQISYYHGVQDIGSLSVNEQRIFKQPLMQQETSIQQPVYHRPPIKRDSPDIQQTYIQPSSMIQQYSQPMINTQTNEVPYGNIENTQDYISDSSEMQLYNEFEPRPVVSFGFGGKLIVMFPKKPTKLNVLDTTTNLPYTVGNVEIHNLSNLDIPEISSIKAFPGPLGPNTRVEDITDFIDQEKKKDQFQLDTFDTRSVARVQLWDLLRTFITNYRQPDDQLLSSIKQILGSHHQEIDSWVNDTQTDTSGFIPSSRSNIDAQKVIIQIQKLLTEGKIEEACNYALNAKLWEHAMLLSSMIDKTTYQKVVTEFAKSSFLDNSPMRTLYLMFADRGDLLFNSTASDILRESQLLKPESLNLTENWQENLAIILGNRTRGSGPIIEKLGDSLWKDNGLVESAHFAYMTADLCTGYNSMQNRVILIGGDHRKDKRHFINVTSIQRTEIFEYLKTKIDPNYIIPTFQTYKFIYAYWLADFGFLDKAWQYVEKIIGVVEKSKNLFKYNSTFLYQLSMFQRRLSEVAKKQTSKSLSSKTSWLWSKIDSGINKLIHGDVDDEPEEEVPQTKKTETKEENESKSSSSGWFSWLPSFRIKRKEPNLGKALSGSYIYDEKHGVWLKPGQKPEDVLQKLAPPPTISNAQPITSTPIEMRAKYVAFGGFGTSEPTVNAPQITQEIIPELPKMPAPKKFFVPTPNPNQKSSYLDSQYEQQNDNQNNPSEQQFSHVNTEGNSQMERQNSLPSFSNIPQDYKMPKIQSFNSFPSSPMDQKSSTPPMMGDFVKHLRSSSTNF